MRTPIALVTLILASAVVRADPPSTHGMLLFGGRATYASHLPMYHSPHDYQVVLKLKFSDAAGSKAAETYAELKKHADLFTLVPEKMDLTQVISGAKTSFSASIFKGHFERGGQDLGEVAVQVEKVVYAQKITSLSAPTTLENYFVFGNAGEHYALHLVETRPSFDEVMEVSAPFAYGLSHCGRAACPDPVKKPLPEAQLPLVLATFSLEKPKLAAPAVGDLLGLPAGPNVSVMSVIYEDDSDLSE